MRPRVGVHLQQCFFEPVVSYELVGLNFGGSVPGYTGMFSRIVCVKSITFIICPSVYLFFGYCPFSTTSF